MHLAAGLDFGTVGTLLIVLGGVSLIVLSVVSLSTSRSALGLQAVDTRWHLYGIWAAIALIVADVVL